MAEVQYSSPSYQFPNDDINPKKKGKEWCRQFAKAMYSDYLGQRSYLNQDSAQKIAAIRAYGDGRQDIRQYILRMPGMNTDANQNLSTSELLRKGYMNINDDVVSIAPKFTQMIVQMFEEVEHDIYADAIDPMSVSTRDEAKYRMWVEAKHHEELAAMFDAIGIQTEKPPYEPDSLEELTMLGQNGFFKLPNEIAIEQAITATFDASRWKEIKRRLIRDVFHLNFIGVKTYFENNQFKVRYVDPQKSGVSYSPHPDFHDKRYAFELVEYEIAHLKTLTEFEGFEEDDWANLAYSVRDLNNVGEGWSKYKIFNQNTQRWGYDTFRVIVLDGEYLTSDMETYEKFTNKNGEDRYSEADYDKKLKGPDRELKRKPIQQWYKCKWIVDTDHVFDYGVLNDQVRGENYESKGSFNFYRIEGKSKMELMIPYLDDFMLLWLKFQNAKARMRPKGLSIEISGFENITLGTKKLNNLELMAIVQQTGDVLYKATISKSFQPTPTTAKPVNELEGGMGNQLNEFVVMFATNIEAMREITGISAPLDASTPDPNQGLGTTKIAISQSTKALGLLYTAYIDLKERTASDIACKIQNRVAVSGEAYEFYSKVIGTGFTQLLKVDAGTAQAKYGITIQARADEQQRQLIQQAALESMKVGKNGQPGITMPDYLLITRLSYTTNLKWVEIILAKRIEAANRRAQEEAIQREQFNKQQDQILAAQKSTQDVNLAEAQMAKDKALKEEDIRGELLLIEAKKLADIEVKNVEHKNKLREILLTPKEAKQAADKGIEVEKEKSLKQEDLKVELELIKAMEEADIALENAKHANKMKEIAAMPKPKPVTSKK